MSTRQDYLTALNSLVSGELPLDEADKIVAINTAMKFHSRHRPRLLVEDFDGDDGFDYALSGFAAWSDGFSVIRQVEYPVDDDDETPDILQDDEWRIYETPAGKYLRFLEDKPAADEDFRATYTALHTCTDSACTIENFDEEAVQILIAALFCDLLSTYYAQSTDSTIAADSVDHKGKSDHYSARARAYRKMYFDHLGITEGQTPAASVTRDQDTLGSWRGDKLTHPQKYR
ncbi:hypothetical protein KKE60_07750 [Patescibacteria group bacterium]|nr:hypothetical protein [Patescibacteria group bacterium]